MKSTPPLILVLLLAACGDGGMLPEDGGTYRDATVVDAPIRMDSSPPPADAATVPDAAPVRSCLAGACDPTDVAACDDQLCVLGASGPMCAEPTNTAEEGMSCEAESDCAAGLSCFQQGSGGVCARICCPDNTADLCGPDMTCTGGGVLVDGTDSGWWRCAAERPCDVFDPADKCEVGEGCYIVTNEGVTDCRRAGDRGVGDSCAEPNDCMPGLFCGGLPGSRTCSQICGLTDGPSCGDGEDCVAYRHSPDGTGICTLAAAPAR